MQSSSRAIFLIGLLSVLISHSAAADCIGMLTASRIVLKGASLRRDLLGQQKLILAEVGDDRAVPTIYNRWGSVSVSNLKCVVPESIRTKNVYERLAERMIQASISRTLYDSDREDVRKLLQECAGSKEDPRIISAANQSLRNLNSTQNPKSPRGSQSAR
ncbi:MAG: hypothetical protein EOP06_06620 [Proteobacteria bacterium]|nr:MAG: hypothetical protein EOP06_06620 [Pseudomonadota bacterium]